MEKLVDEKIATMKVYLERNFGIKSEEDLKKATNNMPKLNMGVFIAPIQRK